jgi:hypothetical protein
MGLFKLIPYLLIGLLWYAYASMGSNPCERIDRGVSPLRVLGDGISWAISPWVGPEAKFEVLKWQLRFDRAMHELAARQVYGADLVSLGCVQSAPEAVQSENLQKAEPSSLGFMDGAGALPSPSETTSIRVR